MLLKVFATIPNVLLIIRKKIIWWRFRLNETYVVFLIVDRVVRGLNCFSWLYIKNDVQMNKNVNIEKQLNGFYLCLRVCLFFCICFLFCNRYINSIHHFSFISISCMSVVLININKYSIHRLISVQKIFKENPCIYIYY